MYLSKIELTEKKRKTLMALRNPNLIHGAISSNYPDIKILWRIDQVGKARNLLLLSEEKVDFTPILQQFGKNSTQIQTVDISNLMDQFKEGSKWRFRIKANPVYRTKNKKTNRKSYCHYMNDKDRISWLEKRSEKNGFTIDHVIIRDTNHIRFQRNKQMVSLASATYDGILTVSNPELFKNTVKNGIGHGKAYGMGMLSLIPV